MFNHAEIRERFLRRAVDALTADSRFVAAWLGGSFGRGEQDEWSDLDLWVVVEDDAARTLCERTSARPAGTNGERLDLISRIGEPAIVHEHHANAPTGGTFTTCVYRVGVVIDWILVSRQVAWRDGESLLLFDRTGVPVAVPVDPWTAEQRAARLSERYAFAWMMAVPAAKAIRRDDGSAFQDALELMHTAVAEIEALLSGETLRYSRRNRAPFTVTEKARRAALSATLDRLDDLEQALLAAGGNAPAGRRQAIEGWIERE